jgi:hypothetical protein
MLFDSLLLVILFFTLNSIVFTREWRQSQLETLGKTGFYIDYIVDNLPG